MLTLQPKPKQTKTQTIKMSYINALNTANKHHLKFRGGLPISHEKVIQVNGIKLYHVPDESLIIDRKATMELNMLLFGKFNDNNDEVNVDGHTFTPHQPIQELNLELQDNESPFNLTHTENWGDDDEDDDSLSPFGNMTPIYSDTSSPLIRTTSFINDPYPVVTPPVRKIPDIVCINDVLDDKEFKNIVCPDCKCFQTYTELGYFEHCCTNYHLDNVEQRLLKEINPPVSCSLMKSDNFYNDDVEHEYDLWKKSENNHIKHILNDNNKTKNICSYCKTFKLPFHNTHSYSNCPHNKTKTCYPEYMNRFSPLQKINKDLKIIL